MSPRSHNVARQLTGGTGQNNATQIIRDQLQSGVAPGLQRAVVVDVIYDPSSLSNAELTDLENRVENPELIGDMPNDSIIARIATNSQDLGHPGLHIFYPFFPSHFRMPIKPGEQVNIIYEDYSGLGSSFGYWISRVPSAKQIEDVNYTHYDRYYDPYNHPRNIPSSLLSNLTASAPTFPNGANTPESFTLHPTGSENPFNEIVRTAKATPLIVFEPVPRFKKRPGDFLIQGSNNARMVLGQDRSGPAVRVSGSNERDIVEQAGAIDLVVGFGSTRKLPVNELNDPGDSSHNPTAPRIIRNTRGNKEVYKTPYRNQKADNPKEGDPDFARDLSRLYLAMKTKGDLNFKVQLSGDGGIFPNSENKLVQNVVDLQTDGQAGQPFAILKSENIRVIAKGKDVDNGPTESGDVRFIKEGTVADKDLSLFLMTKEGRIIFVGRDVQLQTHEDGKVLLRCKSSSAQDSDPVVLFSKFKEFAEDVYSKLDLLKRTIANQLGEVATRGISIPNAAGPFSPIPGLIGAKASLIAAKTAIDRVDVDFRNKIDLCRSKWVFVNKENQ